MPDDSFYKSSQWLTLVEGVLARDNWTCVVPGCGRKHMPPKKSLRVDHIETRKKDGSNDRPWNLRSLCAEHDNQVKEDKNGKRRSGGKFTVRGADASGFPRDPNHAWYK